MTPTTRWAIAQRRKRLLINRTLLDRARQDPQRRPVGRASVAADIRAARQAAGD